MLRRVVYFSLMLSLTAGLTGCCSGPSLILPRLKLEKIDCPQLPDPVFAGPGGVGPIFNEPHIITGGGCKKPCESCCPPSRPVQPIDPFGWLQSGTQGSQIVDPLGWIIGI